MSRKAAAKTPRKPKGEVPAWTLRNFVQDALAPIALFGIVATAIIGAVTNWETIQKHYEGRPLLVGTIIAIAVLIILGAHRPLHRKEYRELATRGAHPDDRCRHSIRSRRSSSSGRCCVTRKARLDSSATRPSSAQIPTGRAFHCCANAQLQEPRYRAPARGFLGGEPTGSADGDSLKHESRGTQERDQR
jgi:hypothetical protein